MNISAQLANYQPGQSITMPVEEFTPEIQSDIINNALGITPAPKARTLGEGEVIMTAADKEKLENYEKVFTEIGRASCRERV